MTHTLHAGARQIDLSSPVCMGILNATPDSFSDGAELAAEHPNRFAIDLDKALRRAEAMVAEGAAILDIGGESTRPGAAKVSDQEQLDRVIPLIEAITQRLDVCVSVDTSAAKVMQAAVGAGAAMINDVRALQQAGALSVAADTDAAVCLMHMKGEPATMQQSTEYDDVVAQVCGFLTDRLQSCLDAGITRERLVIDPGFGFGKSLAQNFQLLKALPQIVALGYPVLVGLSRKSMIGGATGREVSDRVAGSVAAHTLALTGGANILRTHDVAATMDAIRVHSAFTNA